MFLYQMLGYDYKHIDVSDVRKATSELADLLIKAHKEKPKFICYDTETDGLNIIISKPFLVSMGFNKTVITMEYNEEVMNNFWKMYNLPSKEDNLKFTDNADFIG